MLSSLREAITIHSPEAVVLQLLDNSICFSRWEDGSMVPVRRRHHGHIWTAEIGALNLFPKFYLWNIEANTLRWEQIYEIGSLFRNLDTKRRIWDNL